MTDEPMFSCSDINCATEVSYPAGMLRMFEGKPICEGCYEDNPPFDPVDWNNLPPFIPEYQRCIEQLEAEIVRLREALEWYEQRARDCRKIGSIPEGVKARNDLAEDGGERARQALQDSNP